MKIAGLINICIGNFQLEVGRGGSSKNLLLITPYVGAAGQSISFEYFIHHNGKRTMCR